MDGIWNIRVWIISLSLSLTMSPLPFPLVVSGGGWPVHKRGWGQVNTFDSNTHLFNLISQLFYNSKAEEESYFKLLLSPIPASSLV